MTQRSLSLALAALAGALLFAPAALAQDREDPEPEVSTPSPTDAVWDRVLAIAATVGIDTPFGVGGARLEVTPFRYLAIYAGGGVGRDGARFGGGLRPQYPIGNGAVGVMVGLGGGPLDWDTGHPNLYVHRYWEMALLVHAGLTGEYRWDEGIFGRFEIGMETVATPTPSYCAYSDGTACVGTTDFAPVRGWVGLTVGYALDL